MRRRRRYRSHDPDELNVTAFMNLMVALVPFLLMMAVFGRITILELSLPEGQASADRRPPSLQLEVIVRDNGLIVADRQRGVLRQIANRDGRYDLTDLSRTLVGLKQEAPQITHATLLLEPRVPYEQLIQVMDTLRVTEVEHNGARVQAELFPDISLGDAPAG